MPAPEQGARRTRSITSALLVALAATLAACSPEPVPIVYGEDLCVHCRMVIMDDRYGSELVSRTGRVFTFDSIECMAAYVLAMDDTADVHSLWVTAFDDPGTLIPVADAIFLHSPTLKSPMGANLTAFRAAELTPEAAINSFGGEVLDWAGARELVRTRDPMHGTHTRAGGAADGTARGAAPAAHDGAAAPDG